MNIATLPAAEGADTFCEGALLLPVHGVRGGEAYAVQDWVAEEVPVALEFNGISHAVMLATPLDLEDFALGFSLGEGILDAAHELYAVEVAPSDLGITVRLQVSSAAFTRLKQRRRTIAGRTGCGLCGTESLAHVSRELPVLGDAVALSSARPSRARCRSSSRCRPCSRPPARCMRRRGVRPRAR
jgi:FdhD protein